MEKYGTYSRYLGQGGYGTVSSFVKDGKTVAVKKYDISKKGTLDACLREITALKIVSGHPNIVQIIDVIQDHQTINIVMNAHNKLSMTVSASLIPMYFYQMALAVDYCHKSQIWHRDITPSNFLIDRDKVIMIDFSMSCFTNCITDQHSEQTTTSWYRAPEVFKGDTYSEKVDVWALGCVLGEMMSGSALFAGDEADILDYIVDVLPDKIYTEHFFNISYDEKAMSLLKKILVIDPKDRITVEQILADEYLFEARLKYGPQVPCYGVERCLSSQKGISSEILRFIKDYGYNLATWYSAIYINDQIRDMLPSTLAPVVALMVASSHHDVYPLTAWEVWGLVDQKALVKALGIVNGSELTMNDIMRLELKILEKLNYNVNIYRPGITPVPEI